MIKSQLILLIASAIFVLILFQLPKNVVENEQLQEVTEKENHSMEISEEVADQIDELRRLIIEEESIDKKSRFAHSLARHFLDYGEVDSATKYAAAIQLWDQNLSELSADIYFIAYERSSDLVKAREYASKARNILQKLLEKDSTNLVLKNRLAMTLVVFENPMMAVSMLREILAQDSTNRQAILNLGLLAVQSEQFEKAKKRFEKLVSLDSTDHEAKLYLAASMIEMNQQRQARLFLEEILMTQDSIPAIKMMAKNYLEEI